jgi:cytochrome c-type biogenesis protein CcmH
MTNFLRILLPMLGVLLASAVPARAVTPDEMLANPALEARARQISQALRCVVCQNQSIDDSNAPLAKDLRVLVRERLTAGDTDRQAVAYIVTRYGNFVLLKPPLQLDTLLLWLGPALLLGLAGYGLVLTLRRQSQVSGAEAAAPLTSDDEARLARLLDGQK